jgi:hypothetical protein
LHVCQQQREVVHSFRLNTQGFFHSLSLANFRFSVQI